MGNRFSATTLEGREVDLSNLYGLGKGGYQTFRTLYQKVIPQIHALGENRLGVEVVLYNLESANQRYRQQQLTHKYYITFLVFSRQSHLDPKRHYIKVQSNLTPTMQRKIHRILDDNYGAFWVPNHHKIIYPRS